MNFLGQGFPKLQHNRQTDTQSYAAEKYTLYHAAFAGGIDRKHLC